MSYIRGDRYVPRKVKGIWYVFDRKTRREVIDCKTKPRAFRMARKWSDDRVRELQLRQLRNGPVGRRRRKYIKKLRHLLCRRLYYLRKGELHD